MNKLFQDKIKLLHSPHVRGNERTLVIDGERSFVEKFIGKSEFGELFGGYVISADASEPFETEYLGVWGKDKVRKFKQIFIERGAQFQLCEIDGEQRVIRGSGQSWSL